ncbi:MAG: hypothetical protein GY868_16145 [Deltaproteobacteria bacterium]|nr:hypothetical protein [Deltaproteobacteria bacterium]
MNKTEITALQLCIEDNTQHLCITVGDITLKFACGDPALDCAFDEDLRGFLSPGAQPHISLQTCRADLSTIADGRQLLFNSGAIWQLYACDADYLFTMTATVFGPLPYKALRINTAFSRGELLMHADYLTSGSRVYPLEYPLDELIYVNHLSTGKGVEVHACGIVDDRGRGHLFLGESGAGKSTMARLWHTACGARILSDDRIILRNINGNYRIYGTPWHGEEAFACPDHAPLHAVYFLSKAPHNTLAPTTKTDTVSRLLACSFVPLYRREALECALAFLQKTAETIPAYDLGFVPDKSAVDLILQETARG